MFKLKKCPKVKPINKIKAKDAAGQVLSKCNSTMYNKLITIILGSAFQSLKTEITSVVVAAANLEGVVE